MSSGTRSRHGRVDNGSGFRRACGPQRPALPRQPVLRHDRAAPASKSAGGVDGRYRSQPGLDRQHPDVAFLTPGCLAFDAGARCAVQRGGVTQMLWQVE